MKNILFNVPMTKAILDGRKVQTRRCLTQKHYKIIEAGIALGECHSLEENHQNDKDYFVDVLSKYQIGETICILTTIPNLNGKYALDFFGNVYSKAYGDWRKLKPAPSNKGYLSVSISINGKKKTKTIHKMMAETFYREVKDGEQVRHLDSNCQNNHVNNIDIGTSSDNMQDRSSEKNHNGENHGKSKLTQNQVIRIRKSDHSQRQLAREFDVSQHCIMDIKNNNTWNDVVKPIKINIPRYDLARIFLKITNVRVERLQDIGDDDCISEGITYARSMLYVDYGKGSYKMAYEDIWNKTAPKGYQWNDNPYVFVYEFERVEV